MTVVRRPAERAGNVWADTVKDRCHPWLRGDRWPLVRCSLPGALLAGLSLLDAALGAGQGGGQPPPLLGLGMSGLAESPPEAGERSTYHDGWGPRQATPIRQDGVPGVSYKYLSRWRAQGGKWWY